MKTKIGAFLQNAYIVVLMLSIVVLYIYSNLGLHNNVTYTITYYLSNGVAWVLVTLLIVYLLLRSPLYPEISKPGLSKWYYKIGFILLMTILSIMNGMMGGNDYVLFQSGYIGVMLTGMCSGPVYVVLVTVLTILAQLFLTLDNSDLQNYYIIFIVVSGVLSSIISSTGRSRHFWYLVPLVVAVVYALSIPGLVNNLAEYAPPEVYTIYQWSCVSLLLFGFLAITMYFKYTTMITAQENAKHTEHDLGLAKNIQLATLPVKFPDTQALDIYGIMEPATEVAGDFYDCFSIGRNLTAFVVADVSDKGLPASLMMMGVMGAIRTASMLHNDPGQILSAVNREICGRNAAGQFVTVWMGVYESNTGTLQYANAGHPPPYIRRSDGTFEKLPVKKGLMIGVSEDVRYRTDSILLSDQDTIFCYTDGVNEAFNVDEVQFGKERLVKALDTSRDQGAEVIVGSVRSAVKDFVGERPQSDDITMLCFIVHRPNYHELTVPGKVVELENVNRFIEGVLTGLGFSRKDILKMEVVVEEVFVNICDHAYENSEGDVTVYCSARDNEIKLTFADNAKAFNPINKDEIEIDDDIGNWPIGGFGIHMIKNLVTYMDYKNFSGKNIFTVWKRVDHEKSE